MKKIFDYYAKKGLIIDDYFIRVLTNDYCLKKNIDPPEVIVLNDSDIKGVYNFKTVTLKINISKLISEYSGQGRSVRDMNYVLTKTLFHELHHHYQMCNLKNMDNCMLIIDSLQTLNNNPELYTKYHDFFPIEHNAITNSYLEWEDFGIDIGFINTNNKLKILNSIVASKLLNNYTLIKSPLEQYNALRGIKKIDNIPDKLMDKLLFGFPITTEQYKSINDVVTNKKHVKKLTKYIDSL